jgi:hypothetical protein
MIYRLSEKLGKKIKEAPERRYPEHPNPYLDWSAHLFIADRFQYILLSNTQTLYSMVMAAKGISDFSGFILAANRYIAEFLRADGLGQIHERIIAPKSATSVFSKALNRSVTGYMNDFVFHATYYLMEGNLSPFETSMRLNEIPLVKKDFFNAREGFQGLTRDHA